MTLSFDPIYYLSTRPDVFDYYVNIGAEPATGLNWATFAESHYNTFGWKEGTNPNSTFNTAEYLKANIDVAEAAVNPFSHYLLHGVYEGRAPSDSFIAFADFDWETYLDQNPDLGLAGITTANAAYAHFVLHGQFEGRPGTPDLGGDEELPGETFTLTRGLDEFTGTENNDTFQGYIRHLNGFDNLQGGDGNDVLNLHGDSDVAVPVTATVAGIETINIIGSGSGTVDAAGFQGANAVWQVGRAGNISGLANGATAGFRNVTLDGGEQVVQQITDLTVGGNVKVGDTISLTVRGQTFTTTNNASTRPAIQDLAAQINAANIGIYALDISNGGEMRLESTDGMPFTVTGLRNGEPIADPETVQEVDTIEVDGRDYTVSFTGESGVIALDNVDTGRSTFVVKGAALDTLTVEGNLVENFDIDNDDTVDAALLDIDIEGAGGADGITALNLALDTDTLVRIGNGFKNIETIDASGSSGGIMADLTGADSRIELTSVVGGSGDDFLALPTFRFANDATISTGDGADRVVLKSGTGSDNDISVDGGAGNDTLAASFEGASKTDIVLTGGAGGDTFVITGSNIAFDGGDFVDDMGLISITDFGNGSDVLALKLFDTFDSSFAGQNAVDNAVAGKVTLAEAVQAVAALNSLYAQFTFGGSTYLYGDLGGDGLLVDLGGAVLSAANVTNITNITSVDILDFF